jgi:hypothetical protein
MINPSEHKPSSLQPDPEHDRRIAWITKVRGMHRNKRMIGFAGIILGAALVLWARFSPGQAPAWALYAGFGVLAASWIVFIYVIVDRWRWVKKNPYRPEPPLTPPLQ